MYITITQHIVLFFLRLVIYISDDVLEANNWLKAQEVFHGLLPQGLWDAYMAYMKTERIVYKCKSCGLIMGALYVRINVHFCPHCEYKAEAMAGCHR